MILTLDELRQHITTTEDDAVLEANLKALEFSIRRHTHNNFQNRAFRREADIVGGMFLVEALTPFNPGDTVQVSQGDLNKGLYTVDEVTDSTFTVKEAVVDERDVLVTKVVYPPDVKMGVIKLLKWEQNQGEKVGIQSETISRHTVNYVSMDKDNALMGYPKHLLDFLAPYKQARFGRGINT